MLQTPAECSLLPKAENNREMWEEEESFHTIQRYKDSQK